MEKGGGGGKGGLEGCLPTIALNGVPSGAKNNQMDKTIRRYTSLDAMKVDEYRYWRGRSVQERMDAVSELTLSTFALKGARPDVPRLQRTLVRLQHAPR